MSSLSEAIRASRAMQTASTSEIAEWLERHQARFPMNVTTRPLQSLRGWRCYDSQGFLSHESGRFFSIAGLAFPKFRSDGIAPLPQPIILQTDRGILGFLVTVIDGCLMFLGQARMEPGNWPPVQLSPTVQATASNYERVHGGLATPFLELFLEQQDWGEVRRPLMNQLQIEQTDRFLEKLNWNCVIEVDQTIKLDLEDRFRWLTLRDLVELARSTSLLHIDARSVLGSWLLEDGESTRDSAPFHVDELLQWLDSTPHREHGQLISIPELPAWQIVQGVLTASTGPLEVLGVEVSAPSRETPHWFQPLVRNLQQEMILLLMHRHDGAVDFLVTRHQGPSAAEYPVVGPTYSWKSSIAQDAAEIVKAKVHELFPGTRFEVMVDSVQSEEGGRFYRSSSRQLVVEILNSEPSHCATPRLGASDMRWASITELSHLARAGRRLSIELRSLLSQCLLWI